MRIRVASWRQQAELGHAAVLIRQHLITLLMVVSLTCTLPLRVSCRSDKSRASGWQGCIQLSRSAKSSQFVQNCMSCSSGVCKCRLVGDVLCVGVRRCVLKSGLRLRGGMPLPSQIPRDYEAERQSLQEAEEMVRSSSSFPSVCV